MKKIEISQKQNADIMQNNANIFYYCANTKYKL